MVQSQLDPIIGIAVYVVDVYTQSRVDEDSLRGHNAQLRRGRVILADNLVLAAVPLHNDASMSAFRIHLEALEQVSAPGEIGASGIESFKDIGDDRSDWIEVPRVEPRSPVPLGASHVVNRAPLDRAERHERQPTPPPFLVCHGVIYSNHLDELADAAIVMVAEVRTERLVRTVRGADQTRTERMDRRSFGFEDHGQARDSHVEATDVLSLHELQQLHWSGGARQDTRPGRTG